MATSPAHRLGQLIGNLLEEVAEIPLARFCRQHGFYLDKHGIRPARKGKKLRWTDKHGNAHDLDFVIERGGAAAVQGDPIGFIEVAWRRYTKHSRNKAQEIQGAVLPLAERFHTHLPFKGVVLGGVFTDGAVTQLRSLGFSVLSVPYDDIVAAFQAHGMDIRFGEGTPADELLRKVTAVERSLEGGGLAGVVASLMQRIRPQVAAFSRALEDKLIRSITRVVVTRVFGEDFSYPGIAGALGGIDAVGRTARSSTGRGYEVRVTFSNADTLQGRFSTAQDVRRFLEQLQI